MYPRNAASPERLAIGAVVQISDGAVQTSGVTITVRGQGGAEGTGGGTTAYGASGIVYYTPLQAETDFTSFVVIASKTGCVPIAQTVVTTASSVSGTVAVESIGASAVSAVQSGLATATAVADLQTDVDAIGALVTTNLDATVSSRLATVGYTEPDNSSITGIKAKTDSLTFTVAGQLDANVQYVNDVAVTGVGTELNPWGPA